MRSINNIKSSVFKIVLAIVTLLLVLLIGESMHKSRIQDNNDITNNLNDQVILFSQVVRNANIKSNILNSRNPEEISLLSEGISLAMDQQRIEIQNNIDSWEAGHIVIEDDKIPIESTIKSNEESFKELCAMVDRFSSNLQFLIANNETNLQYQDTLTELNSQYFEIDTALTVFLTSIKTNVQQKLSTFELINTTILVLIILLIVILIYRLYRYIFDPFQKVFEGLSSRGLLTNVFANDDNHGLQDFIEHGFTKFDLVLNLINNMNDNSSFEESLKYMFKSFKPFIPYNHIGVALLVDDEEMLEMRYAISDESLKDMPKQLIGMKSKFKNSTLANVIQTKNSRVINDLSTHVKGNKARLYNKILLSYGIRSSLAMPLIANNRPIGIIFFSSQKKYAYEKEHLDFLKTLGDSISMSFYQKIFVDDVLFSGVRAIAKLAEARDSETGDHIQRMKAYTRFLTEKLFVEDTFHGYITPEYIRDIEYFAPIHDIGKVGISDELLLFKGRYSPEQREDMKKHVEFGRAVLNEAAFSMEVHGKKQLFDMPIHIVAYHHEKWDGSGYPEGLRGKQIPLSARIVAVTDVLDALLSKRVYKDAIGFDETLQIMENLSGKEFDPDIISVMMKYKKELFKLYLDLIKIS